MRHSSLGPSQWDRWVRCPGSIEATAGLPDNTSWEAAEGTVFHEMVAECAQKDHDPELFIGQVHEVEGHVIEIDDMMAYSAHDGLEFIRSLQDDPKWEVRIEEEVDISSWAGPDQFGNADMIAWNLHERRVIVFDWKYGQGVPVYPETSYQCRGYALGAWWTFFHDKIGYDPDRIQVDIMIEQPRIPSAGGTWTTSLGDLLLWGAHVKEQRLRADEIGLVPGEKQCYFCTARTKCDALAEWSLDMMGMSFEDLDTMNEFKPPSPLTPERRSAVLRARPLIEKWFGDLHASAYHDASAGLAVPGLKLQPGRRPRRKWNDEPAAEDEAIGWLGRDRAFTEPKFRSPAQIQQIVGRKNFIAFFEEFVLHGEPKLVLVVDEDGSPGEAPIIEEFDNLEESIL